jgi:ABC-type nitrate/sulfonate/bicarbonate transport system substrate-binding protein
MGFRVIATCKEVAPKMSGGVLVVKESLIREHPEEVRRLVAVTRKTIDYVNAHPADCVAITSGHLSSRIAKTLEREKLDQSEFGDISPDVCLRALSRVEYSVSIDPAGVQEAIELLERNKYLEKPVRASDLVDLQFLQ